MKNNKEKPPKDGRMSLTGHLRELRNRLVVALIFFLVGVVASFAYAGKIVTLLTDMGLKYNYVFVYIKPQELLMVYFSISLVAGLVFALPIILYEIYAFTAPGLKKKEKTFMILAIILGMFFFAGGVYFAYRVTLPFMLNFFIGFSRDVAVGASISIEQYVNFLLLVFVIFGTIFELPVVSVLLTGLGLIKPTYLVKARKAVIVVIFLIAAIITPPDIASQIMVAIPMVLLYELSIFLSKVVYKMRRKSKKEEEEEDEEEDESDKKKSEKKSEKPETEEAKTEEVKPEAEEAKAEEAKPEAEEAKAEEAKPEAEEAKAEEAKPEAEEVKAEEVKTEPAEAVAEETESKVEEEEEKKEEILPPRPPKLS